MKNWIVFCLCFSSALLRFGFLNASSYTFVIIPDTQLLALDNPKEFKAVTSWIAENKRNENIKLVAHLGDMVQNASDEEWQVATEAMSLLRPILKSTALNVCFGNHDFNKHTYDYANDKNSSKWKPLFGKKIRESYNWYGGESENDLNHYSLFKAGSYEYICMDIEWRAPENAIEWAKGVMKKHPQSPVILITHAYLRGHAPHRQKLAGHLWEKLINENPQIFMVVNGHYFNANGNSRDDYHQVSKNKRGQDVIEMLVNYQKDTKLGWLRTLKLDELKNTIQVKSYAPSLKKIKKGKFSEFTLDISFSKRFAFHESEMIKIVEKQDVINEKER